MIFLIIYGVLALISFILFLLFYGNGSQRPEQHLYNRGFQSEPYKDSGDGTVLPADMDSCNYPRDSTREGVSG